MNRILVVEDDTSISNVIEISLRNAGYLCDCVYDGTSVAGQLEQEVYDLALVDIMRMLESYSFSRLRMS